MKKSAPDIRAELEINLISAGCPPCIANLIAVECGGSQAIVDIEYLKNQNLDEELFERCLKLVQNFYLAELNLLP